MNFVKNNWYIHSQLELTTFSGMSSNEVCVLVTAWHLTGTSLVTSKGLSLLTATAISIIAMISDCFCRTFSIPSRRSRITLCCAAHEVEGAEDVSWPTLMEFGHAFSELSPAKA